MKVLVVIRRSPAQRFLVELHTNRLVREVAALVGKRRNSQAIATALTKGRLKKEIPEIEATKTMADLILTEESIRWDLAGK